MHERATPPGFDKNPTRWSRRLLLAALALLGLFVSAYLALYQIGVIGGVWDPFFESRRVLDFLGVPDAALGVLAYATEIILLFIGGRERWRTMPWTVLALGVVILSGAVVSVLLILMQAFLVGAWCTLCLASAAISLAIFLLGADEPVAGPRYLKRVRGSGGSAWRALWGRGDSREKRRRSHA
ncbi:MAG TPA: vitamin K epoxide reductase family protein [Rubrobacteraceae bacterium]|nr:vitamin K epoxide reductase family protein [Rubrobacteraceae bacterium]